MATAAQSSIDMGELQGRASELIARLTGAEAGIVTSGAMAGLLVGAAACLAGFDAAKMAQLPDTAGMRHEFIVPRSHRNPTIMACAPPEHGSSKWGCPIG